MEGSPRLEKFEKSLEIRGKSKGGIGENLDVRKKRVGGKKEEEPMRKKTKREPSPSIGGISRKSRLN